MEKDISETPLRIKVRNFYTIIASTVIMTSVVLSAWYGMADKANEAMTVALSAKSDVVELKNYVKRIECMTKQQTNYQIYRIKPNYTCDDRNRF